MRVDYVSARVPAATPPLRCVPALRPSSDITRQLIVFLHALSLHSQKYYQPLLQLQNSIDASA